MSFVVNPYGFGGGSGGTYVNSVQQVSITIGAGATSNTATINSVDTSKTFIVLQGFTTTNNVNDANEIDTRIELTNSTTVTAYRYAADASHTVTVNAVVVEATSSLVESVEYGTITDASASGAATIASVNTARSVVFPLGTTLNDTDNFSPRIGAMTLTNSTTVTVNTNSSRTTPVIDGFVVVQFASGVIQSIQQINDAYTSGNTSDTKTISSVNTANSMIVCRGFQSTAVIPSAWYLIELTNSTTVTLTRDGTLTTSRTPRYTIVEFVSGVLKSNQTGTITLTNATSNTASISSVNTNRTICAYTGSVNALNDPPNSIMKISLTNSTTVTGTVNGSTADAKGIGFQCVEFN
jgi:hypothetical protein